MQAADDIKTYTDRAAALRAEKRYDEAVLAARKAISLDPKHANAWWQLALTLREQHGTQAALSAFENVTRTAPGFAGGWFELGRVHHDGNRIDEAISQYERALEADSEHVSAMRMLAFALKRKEGKDIDARRLELLRGVLTRSTLDDEDTFDLAFLLGAAKEHEQAAVVYEDYIRRPDTNSLEIALANLSLAYWNLERNVDALDAIALAKRHGGNLENVEKRRGLIAAFLEPLEKEAKGRQDSMFHDDWFEYYVNPFVLLDVQHPEDVLSDVKALQKARQRVLREIELEEGKLSWVEGLTLDKSTALARIDELNNPELRDAHRQVFLNKPLMDFLSFGRLAHFCMRDNSWDDFRLPFQMDAEFLRAIGPAFAEQFNRQLTRAVGESDLPVVRVLLGGRRWVPAELTERCFEGAQRVMEDMCQRLTRLSDESDNRLVGLEEVQDAMDTDSLGELLKYLPAQFYASHSLVGQALRNMAVNCYNRSGEAEPAKAILKLGADCAQKSAALAHQMAVDEKALDDIMARERKAESRLTFGKKECSVTKTGVQYGDQHLAPRDIVGVRWGMVRTTNSPPTVRYTIAFQARRGQDILVTWTTSSDLEKQQELWKGLVDAAFAFILESVSAEFRQDVSRSTVRVGAAEVSSVGVTFEVKGLIFSKPVTTPWADLEATISNGDVVLRSRTNRKAVLALPLETTYNAITLYLLAASKEKQPS